MAENKAVMSMLFWILQTSLHDESPWSIGIFVIGLFNRSRREVHQSTFDKSLNVVMMLLLNSFFGLKSSIFNKRKTTLNYPSV
mmetsp:Transcript_8309/g.7040  ORF Transcript_8309/g.7040 Transcript_8309/m.7040 type:complete len:83 (+) Transcript_8309:214-462(+)